MQSARIQSPSSIKTYKNCPRKYYYHYILELPSKSNIHQVRGNIAHSALEHFFDLDISVVSMENYEAHLKLFMQKLLLKEWQNYREKLEKLELSKKDEMHYFEDTLMMLLKWTEQFSEKLAKHDGTFQERFKKLTPMRELLFVSEQYQVRGYIDAIEHDHVNGSVRLMDYKTSKRHNINEHILQLAIYSLLYYEKHGRIPKQVGIYFLKGEERTLDCDEKLLTLAKKEIAYVHSKTCSKDINDYPKHVTGLCKWKTGQCDFYDTCRPHN